MAKVELGTKRTCPKCGARFYDLGNDDPITCIECEETFAPEVLLKPRRPAPSTDKAPPAPPSSGKVADDQDEESDEDEDLLDVDDDDEDDIEGILKDDNEGIEEELSAEVSIETDVANSDEK